MLENIRLPEALRASGHDLPVVTKCGTLAETTRALKAWAEKNPRPSIWRGRRFATSTKPQPKISL